MLELIADEPSSFQDIKLKIDDDKCIRFEGHDRFILVRDDYARIKNTFEYLSRYGQTREALNVTFLRLLAVLIVRCQGKNGTVKLAYYLDERLFSKYSFMNKPDPASLASFLRKPRKRLWMFVMFLKRDPAVMNLLHEALLEVMGKEDGQKLFEVWQDSAKFDPKEVDLPSDMWNRRLFSALLCEFPSFRKGSPRTIARKMAQKYDISPSVFDVTFTIGANKCGALACHDCPFGENLRCHKGSTTQCSIVDWLTLSQKDTASTACDPEGCPIAFDRGKRLCIPRNI